MGAMGLGVFRAKPGLKIATGGVVVAAGLVAFFLIPKQAKADQPATIKILAGHVDVRRVAETIFAPLTSGTSVIKGDVVRTEHDGRAEITYFDGSVTRLNYDTAFQIVELTRLRNAAGSKIIRAR